MGFRSICARAGRSSGAALITSDDGLAPTAQALAEALRQGGNKHITEKHFTTDHSYSDKRIGLEETVLAWLATLP